MSNHIDTTTLNVEYLTKLGACSELIQFVKRNNLEHFPVSRISEIEGDNFGWVKWIKDMLNSVREYDSNGKLIHSKDSNGYEYWKEYDSNGNLIHFKDSYGFEYWHEYDTNGNEIHRKNSYGSEYWKEYDSNGNLIHYKNSDGDECSFHMEYYPSGQLKQYGNMVLPELNVA